MIDIEQIDFVKMNGLIPVVVQDNDTLQVLMVGFMNQEAVLKTLDTKIVTFFSRTKQRLWQKGETSGNILKAVEIYLDCDQDSLLIMAIPLGNTCHTGSVSCFTNQELPALSSIGLLSKTILNRVNQPREDSYTQKLLQQGVAKIAQKVGEEAVEVVIAALCETEPAYLGEMTDLLYHLLVLLHAKQLSLIDVARVINSRLKH